MGANAALGKYFNLVGEANASFTHHVLPVRSTFLQGQLNFHGFIASAGWRHSKYDAGTLELGVYGLEKYVERYRFGYTLFHAYLRGEDETYSHLFQSDYYWKRNTFGIGFSLGEQQEIVGRSTTTDILRLDALVFALRGLHWFDERWALRYGADFSSFKHRATNIDLYDRLAARGESP